MSLKSNQTQEDYQEPVVLRTSLHRHSAWGCVCSVSQETIWTGLGAGEAGRVSCALFCDVGMQTVTRKISAPIFPFFEYQYLHILRF